MKEKKRTGIEQHLMRHHDVTEETIEANPRTGVSGLAHAHSRLHGLGILHMVTIRQPKTHQHVFGKAS